MAKEKAQEAAARRNKAKKEKSNILVYLAGAVSIIVVGIGVYLAATADESLLPRSRLSSREVNDERYLSDVTSSAGGNFTAAACPFFDEWDVDEMQYLIGGITKSTVVGLAGAVQACPKVDLEGGTIPTAFDAREQWAECVPEVRDAGNCSSSYAIAAAQSLSARFCVADSEKYAALNLSPQQVLSCDTGSRGCKGGGVDSVWAYIQRRGLYPEKCLPYAGYAKAKCKTECDESKKHFVTNYCAIGKRQFIQSEIQRRGPVVQAVHLKDDFLVYSGGIYSPTSISKLVKDEDGNKMMAVVTVLGWGKSRGTPYWIVGNSWGTTWGEKGYARIAMDSLVMEKHAFVGHPATEDALEAVNRRKEEEAERKEKAKKERAAREEARRNGQEKADDDADDEGFVDDAFEDGGNS